MEYLVLLVEGLATRDAGESKTERCSILMSEVNIQQIVTFIISDKVSILFRITDLLPLPGSGLVGVFRDE